MAQSTTIVAFDQHADSIVAGRVRRFPDQPDRAVSVKRSVAKSTLARIYRLR
jgi:hypothetical protein